CVIGAPGEDTSAFRPRTEAAGAEEAPANAPAQAAPAADAVPAAVVPAAGVAAGEIKVSPRARHLAEHAGVDLRMAAPTGPEGRVIERDVRALIDKGLVFTKAALASGAPAPSAGGTGIGGRVTVADIAAPASAQPAAARTAAQAPEFEAVKLSNIRKVIAKSMVASLSTMAQLTLNASFDATELLNYRAKLKSGGAALGLEAVTINDMLLFAVSRTLVNHRALNANLVDDTMYFYNNVNLGIAVDTERGLMVPTLFGADTLSLGELSKQAKALITETQKGSVNPDLLRGGSFTVTNLGTLDVESFTPVINPPQTGILGVCCVATKVKEVAGQLKSYPAMGLSLTFDHRAVDGAPAAKFLKELKGNLENFSLLLAK
ncbi:MAG: dihydrolipoamide acetyltransferase family protein, partial [Clostridia bacterium]|nr:dihydrolipoamide acetyltransferase family protein [Clostridia bacterium]